MKLSSTICIGLLLTVVMSGSQFAHSDDAKPQLSKFEYSQRCMATEFRITLFAPIETLAKTAAEAAFRRANELDAKFTDYKPDSELMKLCAKAGQGPSVVSEDLFDIIEKAQDISHISGGAFDITVGPVVRLWRIARRTREMPSASELRAALNKVGYQKIGLNRDKLTVELKLRDMKLDLGGIAKGYTADEMLAVLTKHGCSIALVAAGGDIVAGDAPPGKKGWYVDAVDLNNDKSQTLCLVNQAASTSGDLFQSVEISGKTYSHIVDPKTGVGLTNRNLVTVVGKKGTDTDAYATALAVLEPKAGILLIGTIPGYGGRYVTRVDGKQKLLVSELFNYFLDPNRKE